jgi:hypothetical protein
MLSLAWYENLDRQSSGRSNEAMAAVAVHVAADSGKSGTYGKVHAHAGDP